MDRLFYWADTFWKENGDSRITKGNYLILSSNIIPIVAILSSYFTFIFILGPNHMKNREPYGLKTIIRAYNIFMTTCNIYIFYGFARLTNLSFSHFGCTPVEPTGHEFIHYLFIYFLTKLVELLDTVFFVLRKKYSQASPLHIFHHSFIVFATWMYVNIAPGGSTVHFPVLNSGIHVVMYGYYFLATFSAIQKYLWWKRYLTIAQITQFCLAGISFGLSGHNCNYPYILGYLGVLSNMIFAYLFIDFYKNAYLRKGAKGENSKSSLVKKKD